MGNTAAGFPAVFSSFNNRNSHYKTSII